MWAVVPGCEQDQSVTLCLQQMDTRGHKLETRAPEQMDSYLKLIIWTKWWVNYF